MKLFLVLVLFTALIAELEAYQFYVGGKDGWVVTPSENYNNWAGRLRFQVNDTLFFRYKKGTDSVLVVNQGDYDKCNTHNPIIKMDGGDSVFKLNRSGPSFFISGIQDNCDKGQKMIIVVLAVRNKSPPGSSAPVAPVPAGHVSPASGPISPGAAPETGQKSPAPGPFAPGSAPETGHTSPAPGPIAPGPAPEMGPVSPAPGPIAPGPAPEMEHVSPAPGPTASGSGSSFAPTASPPPSSSPGGTPTSSNATSPPPPPSAGEVVTPSVIILILGVTFVLNLIAGS